MLPGRPSLRRRTSGGRREPPVRRPGPSSATSSRRRRRGFRRKRPVPAGVFRGRPESLRRGSRWARSGRPERAGKGGRLAPPPRRVSMAQSERTGPVLAVFAHPDDAEISSGGVLARWAAEGREVHLLILTNGDRGSNDPNQDRVELAAIRKAESESAATFLGLAGVAVLGAPDGELENTPQV